MTRFRRSFKTFTLGMGFSAALFADSFIGVASTRGRMTVDHSSVRGNASIVPGSKIETTDSASQVQLQNGAQVTLGEGSSAEVFGDRVALRQGVAQIHTKNGYGLDALGFRFKPEQGDATTQISYANANRLMVSAVHGSVSVLNPDGMVLAKLSPGSSYFVEQDSGSQSARGAGKETQKKTSVRRPPSRPRPRVRFWAVTGTVAAAAGGLGYVAANASN
jgi:hypothetical protein